MAASEMRVKVSELKPGDKFLDNDGNLHYEVVGFPERSDRVGCSVRVQFADGGYGFRQWTTMEHTITIERRAQ